MMHCKHENADHLKPGDYYSNGRPFETVVVTCEQFRCIDCGAWLSLGDSNDEPAEVKVEMRAAELAHEDCLEAEFSDEEWLGYTGEEQVVYSREEGPVWFDLDDKRWRAGFLAAEIFNQPGGS